MELVNNKYDKFIEFLKKQNAKNPHSDFSIRNSHLHYNPCLLEDNEWIFTVIKGKLCPQVYLQVEGIARPWFALRVSRDRWYVIATETQLDLGIHKYQRFNIDKPIKFRKQNA